MVARDGIEPSTRGFSVRFYRLLSTKINHLSMHDWRDLPLRGLMQPQAANSPAQFPAQHDRPCVGACEDLIPPNSRGLDSATLPLTRTPARRRLPVLSQKTRVGICTPEKERTSALYAIPGAFFVPARLWRAVRGIRKDGRLLLPVVQTLYSPPPSSLHLVLAVSNL